MNSRERVFALLDGRPVDRPPLMPITMMFAARQIGAHYRDYTSDYRVLAAAQIHIANEFGFDHVSAIAETREAPDCGAEVQWFDDQPYALDEARSRLKDKPELARLPAPDPLGGGLMHERIKALALLKQRTGASKVIEGWVEGPCGAAADLRGINRLMLDFHDDPCFVRSLFDFVVELGLRFGRAQIQAGADIIGIGDPAASLVGQRIYREFVWPWQKRLVDGLHEAGARVRLHICGNTRPILKDVATLGCEIVDIDAVVSMAEARAEMGCYQVLLGNIDPVRILQNGTPDSVRAAVANCRRQAGCRFIIGAGCEIPPDTPSENVRAMS